MLEIARHHCAALARLPRHHRDPFDRMLIAQAASEQLPLMTADPPLCRLRRYPDGMQPMIFAAPKRHGPPPVP
jgi:PIN domain nuclease of toxin-antitoxin system